MIKAMAHVAIVTEDLEKSKHFYQEGLGLKMTFPFVHQGKEVGAYLEVAPGSFVELFAGEKIEAQGALKHLCLEVDNMDATLDQLRKAGYTPSEKNLGADHSWNAWVTDPAGVSIEFHEYTEKSCQRTGEDCHLD